MDLVQKAILLRKKIKEIDHDLTDRTPLSAQQWQAKKDKRADLVAQLKALLDTL